MTCPILLLMVPLVHDWKDKSNSGFAINQVATSSARPTYKANQIGTRGAMRFDGVNDTMFATTALRSEGGAVNVFVVSRRTEKQEGVISARLIGSSAFDMVIQNEQILRNQGGFLWGCQQYDHEFQDRPGGQFPVRFLQGRHS